MLGEEKMTIWGQTPPHWAVQRLNLPLVGASLV